MTSYLLTVLFVSLIVAAYCLFVGLYDRQYKNLKKKRDWLIGIITFSAGIFSATITSAYYIDGWEIKYLAPILVFAVATAAVIVYTCFLKKIYAAKNKKEEHPNERENNSYKDRFVNADLLRRMKRQNIVSYIALSVLILCNLCIFLFNVLIAFTNCEKHLLSIFVYVFFALGIAAAVTFFIMTIKRIRLKKKSDMQEQANQTDEGNKKL